MPELHIQNAASFRSAAVVEGVDPENFCLVWPMVKEGLNMLRGLAPLIPGIGFFVTLGINIVVAAGDAAARSLCPTDEASNIWPPTAQRGPWRDPNEISRKAQNHSQAVLP